MYKNGFHNLIADLQHDTPKKKTNKKQKNKLMRLAGTNRSEVELIEILISIIRFPTI